jgi:hypothetical protein
MQLNEIIARLGPTLLKSQLGDFIIGQLSRKVIQAAETGDIGNGLDIKDQNRFHAGKTPVDK